ncbi:MAG TPA: YceI family protein [bacterium]|nr:YceI family protein [bacterium]
MITYHVTHPLHEAEGKSTAARGKGSVSYAGSGDFLVAVPVKTFDSGDSNRDLHMWEITRAGTHPMVVVNVKIKGTSVAAFPAVLTAEATVDFAGKEKTYSLPLTVRSDGPETLALTGSVPLSLKDFDIQAPSLLAMPIRDDVPVGLDMVWRRTGTPAAADKK